MAHKKICKLSQHFAIRSAGSLAPSSFVHLEQEKEVKTGRYIFFGGVRPSTLTASFFRTEDPLPPPLWLK